MADIHLAHITKRFGDNEPAVKDVSLEIEDGEFMILVGPSGCGKSTILRMLVGLEDVTSGDILIGERRVTDRTPHDRNLAMVFQNYALYPHLHRVREHRLPPPPPRPPGSRHRGAGGTSGRTAGAHRAPR